MGINQVQEAFAKCNTIIAEAQKQSNAAINEAAKVLNDALQQQATSSVDVPAQATTSGPSGETVTMSKDEYDKLTEQLDKIQKVVTTHPELFRDVQL